MKEENMDTFDDKILTLLQENSRMTNKEIGAKIHMTGQAVGLRIAKLLEQGHIKNFSISRQYDDKQFIRIFMTTNKFESFESAINSFSEVDEFYKVAGQACYLVVAHFDKKGLENFINLISDWGRYSVETVISDRKK
jgi:DNA-binding Lrp family transcriptional regulator